MAAKRANKRLSATSSAIDTAVALQMTSVCLSRALVLQVKVNIAIVDPSGLIVAYARMHGAPLHSIDIAVDKAYTAASFGLSTRAWHDRLQDESRAVRDGLLSRPRFVAFAGGLPIPEGTSCIGGIGVSGGTADQDEDIALAALSSVREDQAS